MELSPELLHDNGEWSVGQKWLYDNAAWTFASDAYKTQADNCERFMIGVFVMGSTGQMELNATIYVKYTTKIRKALSGYCRNKGIDFLDYHWLYASDMNRSYPLEEDTPKSLGWPANGCAIISCILGRDYREKRYGSAPAPVSIGKIPRKKIDMRYVPYAHASAVAVASCAVPVNTWASPRRF